ncbi:MAG TPA: 1-deoxy-D-xylulose-5-phosphate synthase [Steroidobacteraceae bacterium]|nr:1-deoxy-D-xylulose-5-phosphate synthase [Steroidobacteraceae bacterium]
MMDVASFPLLSGLESPADLRRLPLAQLPTLARELRTFLVHNAATCAGHFAAGLGTVELAIAVHYVFDTPTDRVVWDGGHQTYPHKVLTGRCRDLPTIRQPGGLQPFPQRAESEYDAFGVGHLSTSISAALGMAVAAARRGEPRRVVAIIGDKALTGGMAFEALNHAGSLKSDLLVILEDSDAHSDAGGLLSSDFARVLSGWVYTQLREGGKKALRQMPTVRELARRSEQHLKGMVLPGTLFEELGVNYIGPLDGHDIRALVATLRNLQRRHGPQLLHVVTRKGKGHTATATGPIQRPVSCDSSAAPPLNTRSRGGTASLSYSQVFGQWLCDMAEAEPGIVGVTPATLEDSGLLEFAKRFPDRCFDLSVAHQHAVTFAAGLATEGLKPVVAIPSTYLQRTYDQLIHDVALQRLPVLFAIDRAGLVGGDGASHQGSYDLSYLRCIPNLTIMAPADENECRQMLYTASTLFGPVLVRYPRGNGPGVSVDAAMSALAVGRAQECREGHSRLALLVFGAPLAAARAVAERLDATLVNMRFVKPLDVDLLTALSAHHRAFVTIEENAIAAGAGSAVAEALVSRDVRVPLLQLGIPDRFIEHGSRESCLAAARLDATGLSDSIERWWTLHQPMRSAAGG